MYKSTDSQTYGRIYAVKVVLAHIHVRVTWHFVDHLIDKIMVIGAAKTVLSAINYVNKNIYTMFVHFETIMLLLHSIYFSFKLAKRNGKSFRQIMDWIVYLRRNISETLAEQPMEKYQRRITTNWYEDIGIFIFSSILSKFYAISNIFLIEINEVVVLVNLIGSLWK